MRGNKEHCFCYVTNRFNNLNSRSAVCCQKNEVLTYSDLLRFSRSVIGKVFQSWRAAISNNGLCTEKEPLRKLLDFNLSKLCVQRLRNGGNTWVHLSSPILTLSYLTNQTVLLLYVSSSPEWCLEMPSAAGLWTGCMHRRAARSRNWLLCETKCEVTCCEPWSEW